MAASPVNSDVVEFLKTLKKSLDDPMRRRGVDRAIGSVTKYPVRLVGESDAKDLVGVGEWIGKRIGGFLGGKEAVVEVDVGAVEGVLSQHCPVVVEKEKKIEVLEAEEVQQIEKMKVVELRAKLRQHNLLIGGTKPILVERLVTFLASGETSGSHTPLPPAESKKPKKTQFPVSLLSQNGKFPSLRYGSTSYAIILALRNLSRQQKDGGDAGIHLNHIITEAQKHTKVKLTTPDPQKQWFTTAAQPLRTTLTTNGLVEPRGTNQYVLTELGKDYGNHLWSCHTLETRHDITPKPQNGKKRKRSTTPKLSITPQLPPLLPTPRKVEYVVIGEEEEQQHRQKKESPPRTPPMEPEDAGLSDILKWGRELGVRSPPPRIPESGKKKKKLRRSRSLVKIDGKTAIVRSKTPVRGQVVVPERVEWKEFVKKEVGGVVKKKKNKFSLNLGRSGYKVICVVDHRERHWGSLYVDKLSKKGVNCTSRALEIGDFTWIAVSPEGVETMLDVLVERKRVSDLVSSILGGRYSDQKRRMMAAGVRRLIYLVEGGFDGVKGPQAAAVETALLTTCLFDGMYVEHCANVESALMFLTGIHRKLEDFVAGWVGGGGAPHLPPPPHPIPPPFGAENTTIPPSESAPQKFVDFNSAERIRRSDASHENLFQTQLTCIKGVGYNGAGAIASRHPTPLALYTQYQKYSEQNRTAFAELLLSTVPVKSSKAGRFIGDHCSSLVYNAFTQRA